MLGTAIALIVGAAVLGGRDKPARGSVGRPTQRMSYPLDNSEETRVILELRAQALAEGNAVWMASRPKVPCCADCLGVTYVAPADCGTDGECQDIQDAADLIRSKAGTCIEIAAYDAGHMMVEGIDARVVLEENGPFDYHAVIKLPDGTTIDPTENLRHGHPIARGCQGGCGV